MLAEDDPGESGCKTPSMLSKSDAVDPGVNCKPNMSISAPNTPPQMIAPNSHGTSLRCNGASADRPPTRRSRYRTVRPNPEPRYSKPAKRIGETPPSNSLLSGVLAPNSAAASRALSRPVLIEEGLDVTMPNYPRRVLLDRLVFNKWIAASAILRRACSWARQASDETLPMMT